MSVGSVSSCSASAFAAVQCVRLGSDNLKAQIGTAVLNQIQEQQKAMARALVQMMEEAAPPEHLGRVVDVRA